MMQWHNTNFLRATTLILFISVALIFLYLTRYQNVELGRDMEKYLMERVTALNMADATARVITGSGPDDIRVVSTRWPLRLPGNDVHQDESETFAAVVDVVFIHNGYRGYVNVIVREGDDLYTPRQWGLTDSVLWKAGQRGRLIVPFPEGLDLKRTQIELISYARMAHQKQRIEIHDVALYKIKERPDPGAKQLRLLAGIFIAVAMVLLIVTFRDEISLSIHNSLSVPAGDDRRLALIAASATFVNPAFLIIAIIVVLVSRYLQNRPTLKDQFNRLVALSITTVGAAAIASLVTSIVWGDGFLNWGLVIGGIVLYIMLLMIGYERSKKNKAIIAHKYQIVFLVGAAVLLSMVMLEAFPITSNRLRADAWQFDIVARSLAEGLGFKSYDVWELGSYPIVPLYFSIFHLIFGQGAVSTVWANATTVLAIWFVLYRMLSKHALKGLVIAGILLVAWTPFWTTIGWSLSEYLSQLILIVMVYLCSLVHKRIQSGGSPFGLLVWLGIVFGIAVLIRTDYYVLLPVLLIWLMWVLGKWPGLKAGAVVVFLSVLVSSPWWIFQATHETPYRSIRSSDLSRMVDAALVIAGVRQDQDFRPGDFVNNLKSSITRPYLLYVYDVPTRRNEAYSYHVHRLILGLFLLTAFYMFRKSPGIGIWLATLILGFVVWRTGVLALLADLNRHFAQLIPIMIVLLASMASSLITTNVRHRRVR
jgi:hypothetical protein